MKTDTPQDLLENYRQKIAGVAATRMRPRPRNRRAWDYRKTMIDEPNATLEADDNHIYQSIFIYKETFDFLLKSLHFYRELLKRSIDAVNVDEDLKALLDGETQQSSPVRTELTKVENAIAWWEKVRENGGDEPYDYNIGSFSHGTIRFLKSVACLYLRHLRRKRDDFSNRTGEPKYILESLDNALSRFDENAYLWCVR